MADIRPRSMTQGELAELLRENGFPACSKAAVSLAERPKESGVRFTPEARKIARRALNSTVEHGAPVCAATGQDANRKNPNKTTVWLDDETRIWLEERAYMEDSSVGAVIRAIIMEAKNAASDAGTSEAATEKDESVDRPSDDITETEENQV